MPLLKILLCVIPFGSLFSQSSSPSDSALLFMPNLISDEYGNRDMAISPSGDEMFYTLQFNNGFSLSVIMHSTRTGTRWSRPEVAAFSGMYNDLEPCFSPDGQKLFFVSNRPDHGKSTMDFDIWYLSRSKGEWIHPTRLRAPVNTDKDEFYPSVAKNGNIYFTREMDSTGEDIVMCRYTGKEYEKALPLPPAINSKGAEFNAFIDPDEQYLIYTAYRKPGNLGTGDLYMSKKEGKEWMPGINLGPSINGPGLTYCPYVSADKKTLFFSSARGGFKAPFKDRKNLKQLQALMHGILNGKDNIYWIRFPNEAIR